jgi:hypothetical protein
MLGILCRPAFLSKSFISVGETFLGCKRAWPPFIDPKIHLSSRLILLGFQMELVQKTMEDGREDEADAGQERHAAE